MFWTMLLLLMLIWGVEPWQLSDLSGGPYWAEHIVWCTKTVHQSPSFFFNVYGDTLLLLVSLPCFSLYLPSFLGRKGTNLPPQTGSGTKFKSYITPITIMLSQYWRYNCQTLDMLHNTQLGSYFLPSMVIKEPSGNCTGVGATSTRLC